MVDRDRLRELFAKNAFLRERSVELICDGQHHAEWVAAGPGMMCKSVLCKTSVYATIRLCMPFIDTNTLVVKERLPGWYGRYFHSKNMTVGHYEFVRGASIHEHCHPEEEIYEVIDGEIELTLDGISKIVRPGIVAVVPANALHSVMALTDGRAIIVDSPARPDFA